MTLFCRRPGPTDHSAPKRWKLKATKSPEPLTREELDAALNAIGTVLGCAAREFGETYYQPAKLTAQLSLTVEQASKETKPYLKRLLSAMLTYREPPKRSETWHDRFYRESHGS